MSQEATSTEPNIDNLVQNHINHIHSSVAEHNNDLTAVEWATHIGEARDVGGAISNIVLRRVFVEGENQKEAAKLGFNLALYSLPNFVLSQVFNSPDLSVGLTDRLSLRRAFIKEIKIIAHSNNPTPETTADELLELYYDIKPEKNINKTNYEIPIYIARRAFQATINGSKANYRMSIASPNE